MDLLLALRDVGIVAPQHDDAGDRLIRAALDREIARVSRSAPGDVRKARRRARRVGRRALALSVPATAAAATTATTATLLLTAGGASGPSPASAAIIRHVRAELTAPPGQILHESATVTLPDGSSTPFELWVQTGGTGVYRVIKYGQEVSLSATKNEIYNPSTNTVTVSPLPPAIHQLEVSKGGDPAAELKRMVESGQATATPTTYNGTPAYKLSVNSPSDTLLNGTAYVARSDYRPLELDSAADPGAKVVFSAYEHLPATPANDALLAVTSAHPGATVVNQP
jgi:hypothetical protein